VGSLPKSSARSIPWLRLLPEKLPLPGFSKVIHSGSRGIFMPIVCGVMVRAGASRASADQQSSPHRHATGRPLLGFAPALPGVRRGSVIGPGPLQLPRRSQERRALSCISRAFGDIVKAVIPPMPGKRQEFFKMWGQDHAGVSQQIRFRPEGAKLSSPALLLACQASPAIINLCNSKLPWKRGNNAVQAA